MATDANQKPAPWPQPQPGIQFVQLIEVHENTLFTGGANNTHLVGIDKFGKIYKLDKNTRKWQEFVL
jgi:hypothetical protein